MADLDEQKPDLIISPPGDLPRDPEESYRTGQARFPSLTFLHEEIERLIVRLSPDHAQPDDLPGQTHPTPALAGFERPPAPEAPEALQDPPSEGPRASDQIKESPGEGYHLLRKIAFGGCGEIWEAEQRSLNRIIAIKRLRLDRDAETTPASEADQEIAEQFRQEALLAASLQHPNIMPVYDLSMDEEGYPLIAMKRVYGTPWSELLRKDVREMSVEDFLARHIPVFIQVVQAVAFAHSRSIIHRDIKPSQVMVGDFGEVLLMDWGLAVSMDSSLLKGRWKAELQPLPATGQWTSNPSGTPLFMAPEQTSDRWHVVGPWTDVYLLGATLYLLLTGSPPRRAKTSQEAFIQAARGVIVPLRDAAGSRPVPEELEQLIRDAMVTDYEKRTLTVAEFLERLRSFQLGHTRRRESKALVDAVAEEVENTQRGYRGFAGHLNKLENAQVLWPDNPNIPALRERLYREYSRRALELGDLVLAKATAERLPAGETRDELFQNVHAAEKRAKAHELQRRVAFAAVLILLVIAVVTAAQAIRETRRANQELVAKEAAIRQSRESEASAHRARQLAEREQYYSGIGLVSSAINDGHPEKALETLLGRIPESERQWEWGALLSELSSDEMTLLKNQTENGTPTFHSDFSPDGTRIAVGHLKGKISIFDARTGRRIDGWTFPVKGFWCVRYSPEGDRLLATSMDGWAYVLDAHNGETLHKIQLTGASPTSRFRGGAWSPDGKLFATTGNERAVRIYDAETAIMIKNIQIEKQSYEVDFSPDGAHLAVAQLDNSPAMIINVDTASIQYYLQGQALTVLSVGYSPDGSMVATACNDGHARIYDSATGQLLKSFLVGDVYFRYAAFSPDGKILAVAGNDSICRLWDVESGRLLGELIGAKQMEKVTFHPTERILVATSFDQVMVWNLDRLLPHPVPLDQVKGLAAEDHEYFRVPSFPDDRNSVWDDYDDHWLEGTGRHAMEGEDVLTFVDSFYRIYSPDGRWRVELGYVDSSARLFDATTNKEVKLLLPEGEAFNGAFNRGGGMLALTNRKGEIVFFDTENWQEKERMPGHKGVVETLWTVAFSPDDGRVALGWRGGAVAVRDLVSGEEVWYKKDAHQQGKPVVSIDWSDDGSRIVTGSSDETAKVWDAATGKNISTMKGHRLNVLTVDFNPDGTRVLTSSLDERAKLWETETGREIMTIFEVPRNQDDLMAAFFGRDGSSAYFITSRGSVHRVRSLPWEKEAYGCDENVDFTHCVELWKRRQRGDTDVSLEDIAW